MSGFSWLLEVGRPGRREARDHAAAVRLDLPDVRRDADRRAWPPLASRNARSGWPSRSEIIPAGIGSRTGIGFASPKRLSTSTIPVAPPSRARSAFETKRAEASRDQRDLAARASRSAALPRPCSGRSRAAEVRLDGLPVGSDDRGPTSTIVWSSVAQAGGRAGVLDRHGAERRRPAHDAQGLREDVRVRDRRDRDRVRRACPASPSSEAEVLAIVAGRDHRNDPRERGVVHGLVHRVVRRVGLGPAAREVDHVHAVGDR